ncbi:hypothetical protein PV328_005261 [Microctonus aethiopoides]|uniref:Uncharacterized protein n=1 Tax=Microctonus aethiopoides TaxID=144406 RepID=A0AA39FLW8_9HYME|nr:hypothetical protein PV328_005261 [Microctonus aethiopoides]
MRLERSLLIVESILGILQLTLANSECFLNATTPWNKFEKVLLRKKRHLVFPKNSAFVLTITGLKAIQIKEPSNWNLLMEFDMIWPIPINSIKYKTKKLIKKQTYHRLRRQKRNLYETIEATLNRMGLSGRNCILRTICEAKTFLHPPGISFVDDLLRVILSHEENFNGKIDSYDMAHKTKANCDKIYNCPISLLQLLLNNDYI